MPTRVIWRWPGWLPASRLTLAGGKPGDGKSTLAIDLTARFSTAGPMPDGYRPDEPINVGILSAEDGASDTVVPRFIVAGADLTRVHLLGGVVTDNRPDRPWVLPDDMSALVAVVRTLALRLLVLDPLSAFQAARVDTHRDGAVRGMLYPLAVMAEELDCAVLAVRHHRKGGATDARDAGSGSIAFTAAARVEWAAGAHPDDSTRFVLAVAKNNLSTKPRSLAYRIAQDDLYDTNRVVWEGATDITASDLTRERGADDRSEVDEAADFITETLSAGALGAKAVKDQAAKADISAATLRRAKQRLKVRSRKTAEGTWVWELHDQGARRGADPGAQPLEDEHLEHLPSTHTI